MGVSHLSSWSGKAKGSKAPSGRADAVQIRGLKNPAYTDGGRGNSVPKLAGVQKFANHSGVMNTGVASPAHPESGGRAGSKSGQPKIGGKAPKPGMTGGRLG